MITRRKKILFLLTFFLLFAACESKEMLVGDQEITLSLIPPEPLSNTDAGVYLGPEAASRMKGDVDIDLGEIPGDVDDVFGIVIAIIPAKIHFDTLGTYAPSPPSDRGPVLQQDEEITVTFYFAPFGEENPFQEEFLAAAFFIDIQGTEVVGVSDSVDLPQLIRNYLLSGHTSMGINIESTVTGRLSIESLDLIFHL